MTVPAGINQAADDSTYTRGTSAALTVPALMSLQGLTGAEEALVSRLTSSMIGNRWQLELRNAYYRGTAAVKDLGISIPPQMRGLRVALGWPRVCVDALDERVDVEGFRYAGSTDVDEDLQRIWQANDMESEQHLAHLDAFVFGAGYVSVGSADDGGDEPLIRVESPLDMAVEWDARTRSVKAAVRLSGDQREQSLTLYLPDETVYAEHGAAGWVVTERDQHRLGRTLIHRLANRARSYDHSGASEITPELMSITDAAARTLQGLEVAREFYSAPQRYILGASESDFQDASGNAKSAFETYLGRILALERDENGEIPTVGQFTPYDPSVFTKVIDMYAGIVASLTGLPPHMLGYTTDNPASADAIRSTDMRLKKKADRKCHTFGPEWADVQRSALLVRDGSLPSNAASITTDWADTGIPTPAATTDALVKQIEAGSVPATSDVTLKRLGYSAVERQRLEQDRATDQGQSMLQEIAHSLNAKALRTDSTVVRDAANPNAVGQASSANGNSGS